MVARHPMANLPRWLSAIAALSLSLLASTPAWAELTVRLNSLQVEENERIRLTLRIDRNDAEKEPDFNVLNKDFRILSRPSRSSQFQSINGRITAWTDWTLYIQPKRTGRLVVPPISYEGETSLSQSVLVAALDPSVKRSLQQRVFFETSTTPKTPYVQAQITFVRRLLYSDGTQIYGEIPDVPKIENAVVVQLGTPTSRKVERFGQRYSMIEQRYAIFPESSGSLTIPGANVTGSVRTIVNQRIRRNSLSVNAEPIDIEVRPIPAGYPKGVPWFPAEDVQIIDAWDKDPLVFSVGEPINQSVIVSSAGSTGSIIPPVDYELPASHFRIYPEQPNISDNPSAERILGVRAQNFSLIPIAAGAIELPEVELTWWDTTTEQVRIARLPSRRIDIGGESVVRSGATANSTTDITQPNTLDDSPSPSAVDAGADSRSWLRTGLWLAAALILVGAIRWAMQSGKLTTRLAPRWLQHGFTSASPKARHRALLRCIAQAQPGAIRDALEHYLQALRIRNIDADTDVADAMRALISTAAYAPNDPPLARDRLSELANSLRKARGDAKQQPLPALYNQRA